MRHHTVKGTPRRPGIYAWVNRISGKCYVGSAVCLKERKSDHLATLRRGSSRCVRLQNAWNKHGEAAFEWRILEAVADPALLVEREQFWIDELGAHASGYNTCPTAGSTLGRRHSDETRAKLREATLCQPHPPLTEEHKARIGEAHKGRFISPEHRAKIAATLKGRPWPQTALERAAAVNRGHPLSPEHRANISAGRKAWNASPEGQAFIAAQSQRQRGRRLSDEQKAKLSAAALGRKLAPETVAKIVAKTRGRRAWNSKLTPDQVAAIRRRHAAGGITMTALAVEHGVSVSCVSQTIAGTHYPPSAEVTRVSVSMFQSCASLLPPARAAPRGSS